MYCEEKIVEIGITKICHLFLAQWVMLIGILLGVWRLKGSPAKRIGALQTLRHLLSCTAMPPVHVAIEAGVVTLLVDCLAFGSSEEQVWLKSLKVPLVCGGMESIANLTQKFLFSFQFYFARTASCRLATEGFLGFKMIMLASCCLQKQLA